MKYTGRDKSRYRNGEKPTWCRGCSYYSVLDALTRVFARKGIDPQKVNVISGIGCSSRLPLFLDTLGMHTLHGRALPVAVGARLARPDIPVVVVAGDGDLFSIGTSHFVHTARKNFDLTVLCLDNRNYAMTKNQSSPTSPAGHRGSLTPFGKLSVPLNVPEFAIASGATLVSRTLSSAQDHMRGCISQAFEHKGFSLVEILAPCRKFDREAADDLSGCTRDLQCHPFHDRTAALKAASGAYAYDPDGSRPVPVGLFWKTERSTFEEQVESVRKTWEAKVTIDDLLNEADVGNRQKAAI
ncbi:MAG: thiamine pyrophosphate-dependent enzyme [Chitinispirillaceae bacterium]